MKSEQSKKAKALQHIEDLAEDFDAMADMAIEPLHPNGLHVARGHFRAWANQLRKIKTTLAEEGSL